MFGSANTTTDLPRWQSPKEQIILGQSLNQSLNARELLLAHNRNKAKYFSRVQTWCRISTRGTSALPTNPTNMILIFPQLHPPRIPDGFHGTIPRGNSSEPDPTTRTRTSTRGSWLSIEYLETLCLSSAFAAQRSAYTGNTRPQEERHGCPLHL